MYSFNLTQAYQSVVNSLVPRTPRKRNRRVALSTEPAMIEMLESRKVLSATVIAGAVSPDGHHTAQVVSTGVGTVEVIKDGAVVGSFHAVNQLQFSPSGNHLAFIGVKANGLASVYLDGHALAGGASFQTVTSLKFSADGTHLGFVASKQGEVGAELYDNGTSVASGLKAGARYDIQYKENPRLLVVIAIIAILIG